MGNYLDLERIIWFDAAVRAGKRPNAKALQEKFEFSESTARRLIHFCRDTLNAPLEYDWQRKGFYYRDNAYRLPLLQPRQEEMLAILLARNLLAATAGGLISREIDRFGRRLLTATTPMGLSPESIAACFSAQWHGHSPADEPIFRTVTTALLEHRLLRFDYASPLADDDTLHRQAEPHHLQHYLGSWVLLAWCRLRREWRKFFLARMGAVTSGESFTPRPRAEWQGLIDAAFGIFQGGEERRVVLRFPPSRARWIREQTWHEREEKRPLADGGLELCLPVTDLREIKLKVLQFGAEVEVVEPAELRELVAEEAEKMIALYAKG